METTNSRTLSAWTNSINAATGGIGMLVSSQAYNTIASVEIISPRKMIVNFQGNPNTSVISCYSPTNVSDETYMFDKSDTKT